MLKYRKRLRNLVNRMTKEVSREIRKLFSSNTAEEFIEQQESLATDSVSRNHRITQDESISSKARILLNKLTNKFKKLFSEKSYPYSEDMVKGQIKASNISLKRSLKEMSADVTLTSTFLPKNIKEIAKASIAENVDLIKSIPAQYMQKIQGSVMRAITSGGNLQQLKKTLTKYEGITERRAKNIATDQVRKAYNTVNKQRMMNLGVTKFVWLHSYGGQKPREDHIAMNGNIYSFDDLPVIDKRTGERGIPGQAINCFLGNTKISLSNGCRNLWRYWHSGSIVSIALSSSEVIECTLNHPILTLRGWLPANEIKEGDYLIGCKFDNNGIINNEKANDIITFDDFFNSICVSNINCFSASKFNFHGDIPNNNVDSVLTQDFLPNWAKSINGEQIEKLIFSLSDVIRDNFIFRSDSQIFESGSSSNFRYILSFFDAHFGISHLICQGAIPEKDSILFQNFANYLSTNAIDLAQAQNAFAIFITFDDLGTFRINVISLFNNRQNIVESFLKSARNTSWANFMNFAKALKASSFIQTLHRVDKKLIRIFEGHVYTMETFNNWYTVTYAGIISKNCGCTMKPVFELND